MATRPSKILDLILTPEGGGVGSPMGTVWGPSYLVRVAVSSHAHGTESADPSRLGLSVCLSLPQSSVPLPVYSETWTGSPLRALMDLII